MRHATDAKPAKPAAPASPPAKHQGTPKPPPDPRVEALDARWRDFAAADYEGKFGLFARTPDDPELLDGEMAFDMLDQLFGETIKHRERDRFDAPVVSLRERRAEVYAEEANNCLAWRITNALVAARSGDVPALARELAPLAGKAIDIFVRVRTSSPTTVTCPHSSRRCAPPGRRSNRRRRRPVGHRRDL